MNKVLVKIYFPLIEENYELWIPPNKKIYSIILILLKLIGEKNNSENDYHLYNKYTGYCYDLNLQLCDTDIKNGTELIFI